MPPVTGAGKNGPWKKQEFLIETMDQYPKKVIFSVWGDKVDFATLSAGQPVKVFFDVESREYNGKWYTDCRAWKVEANNGQQAYAPQSYSPAQAASTGYAAPSLPAEPAEPSMDDDLPF